MQQISTKRIWNIKVPVVQIVIGALGKVTKALIKGLEDLEIREKSGDHPNYCIIEIGQNTEKSPGDLRRVALTQTPVTDHQISLVRKILVK